jgi:hypothetical protein
VARAALAQRTIPVDETDHEPPARDKHAMRFGHHRAGRVHEANCRDHEGIIEAAGSERQRFCRAGDDLDTSPRRLGQPLGGWADADTNAKRGGKPPSTDADFDPTPQLRHDRSQGQKLGDVGGRMPFKPLLVLLVVNGAILAIAFSLPSTASTERP